MNNKYLILDCNYLCHSARYTMGDLSYKGKATGVIYGFLKDLVVFQNMFNTPNLIFCWDYGRGIREEYFPLYKAKRRAAKRDMTKQEQKFAIDFAIQMKRLRRRYLRWIGFKNIFYKKGYESDDMIASVCKYLPKGSEAIIISADKDLYQLISPYVSVYDPRKHYRLTLQRFKHLYNISPKLWVMVKGLAGCNTDNVPGLKGVGEKTAIKYINGLIDKDSKMFQRLITFNSSTTYERNLRLIILPYDGTPIFKLRKDKLLKEGWKKVMQKLGMKSLERFPFQGRKYGTS